jgi:hypothetical protein
LVSRCGAKEDLRLLTGRGSFADDVRLPKLQHAVIVRSLHAHADIPSVDDSSLQSVRELTGLTRPPRQTNSFFDRAVDQVLGVAHEFLDSSRDKRPTPPSRR